MTALLLLSCPAAEHTAGSLNEQRKKQKTGMAFETHPPTAPAVTQLITSHRDHRWEQQNLTDTTPTTLTLPHCSPARRHAAW